MTEMTGSVLATFGGQEMRFAIAREDLVALEMAIGLPAYTIFTKFAGGLWSVTDLCTVLNFAAMSASDKAPHRQTAAVGFNSYVLDRALGRGCGPSRIDRVLLDNAPARYAALALKILEASLFGLAPDDAVFDENDRAVAA
ncbi:hypothetical protein [Kaistia sp. UC242_56]|uniref:hypothetical protein n=1 Tax=Kaistia sp. UC242_56 TaxID=3374625 RepID=UPI0037B71B99